MKELGLGSRQTRTKDSGIDLSDGGVGNGHQVEHSVICRESGNGCDLLLWEDKVDHLLNGALLSLGPVVNGLDLLETRHVLGTVKRTRPVILKNKASPIEEGTKVSSMEMAPSSSRNINSLCLILGLQACFWPARQALCRILY